MKEIKDTQIHICERCGKVFIGNVSKYSTNRFCSRSCANTRDRSEDTKKKIRDSVKANYIKRKDAFQIRNILGSIERERKYNNSPKYCIICKKKISYQNRNRITCSEKCLRKHFANCAGLQGNNGLSISGKYKGFYCASTYELAYIIYCLDHNINIQRCKEYFEYEYKGKKHRYYPDFIVDDEIIEIKGFWNEVVDIKKEAVLEQNRKYKILYRKDLQYCFDYIEKFYNKTENLITDLYENFYRKKYIYNCTNCGKEFISYKERKTVNKFCCKTCSGQYGKRVYLCKRI